MPSEQKFSFESIQDAQSIREYLLSVIEGIERGSIVLTTAEEEIVLTPARLLKFSVKARKKGTSGKLKIRISWKPAQEDCEPDCPVEIPEV